MDGNVGTVTALGINLRCALQTELGKIVLISLGDTPVFYVLEPRETSAILLCEEPEEPKRTSFLSGEKRGYDLLAYNNISLYGWNLGDDILIKFSSLRFSACPEAVLPLWHACRMAHW